jgi:hypothetical protein
MLDVGLNAKHEFEVRSTSYKNRSVTRNFSIETFLEITDSSIKNIREFEYDDQNWP